MSQYPVRINKFISATGYCPRKEADRLIKAKQVTHNGEDCRLGTLVEAGDVVIVQDQILDHKDYTDRQHVYLAYHKPVGVTCTAAPTVKNNIVDAITHEQRIFPIGRLDKASEGLLLMTSDGDIVNKILRAENAHDKEYLVDVDKPITEDFLEKMASGVEILDTITKPCEVSLVTPQQFRIILHQGLNRQIRRMSSALGYKVQRLQRLRIMNIELADLPAGEWRALSEEELAELKATTHNSINCNKFG
ncbi:pseudouridine synthase [Litoribrevibacter euphylliae]|uniref:Pseudouridine synthase n=1 Tax=Litoribrevibacter euphylliae TaxID=1834034 RepID=A0ABV7H9P1_9GAMM